MIKESCNLIGQEHILVNMLYMIKRLFFPENSIDLLIFHSELLLLWPYPPQTNQIQPW